MKVKFSLPTLVFFVTLIAFNPDGTYTLPFFAAILHELGHIAVMCFLKIPIRCVTVLPFGVDINAGKKLTSYPADIALSGAGVAVNLLCVILGGALPSFAGKDIFISANLLLILVNILPIKGLDGGQLLEKSLLLFLEPNRVDFIINAVSFAAVVALGAVAIWLLFFTGGNFTLLLMCGYLFVTLFLKRG